MGKEKTTHQKCPTDFLPRTPYQEPLLSNQQGGRSRWVLLYWYNRLNELKRGHRHFEMQRNNVLFYCLKNYQSQTPLGKVWAQESFHKGLTICSSIIRHERFFFKAEMYFLPRFSLEISLQHNFFLIHPSPRPPPPQMSNGRPLSRLSMIVRVNVVLNRTVVVDNGDCRFDNMSCSHLQS